MKLSLALLAFATLALTAKTEAHARLPSRTAELLANSRGIKTGSLPAAPLHQLPAKDVTGETCSSLSCVAGLRGGASPISAKDAFAMQTVLMAAYAVQLVFFPSWTAETYLPKVALNSDSKPFYNWFRVAVVHTVVHLTLIWKYGGDSIIDADLKASVLLWLASAALHVQQRPLQNPMVNNFTVGLQVVVALLLAYVAFA